MGSASEFAKVLPDRMSATAVSEEEAAANAAQAIFSIRKHRMDLITGEAGENVFGAGLKDALAALDAAEAAEAIFSLRKHRIELITGEAGENVFGAGLAAAL